MTDFVSGNTPENQPEDSENLDLQSLIGQVNDVLKDQPDPKLAADNQTADRDGQATCADVGPDAGKQSVDQVNELKDLLAERTSDLQRLQAEYANYKKRVDRDRDLARQKGVEDVVEDIIPVFDAIDIAKQHEQVSEGFIKLEDLLVKACEKNGLVAFGEVGEEFNPHIHEAMMSHESTEVSVPTCVEIFQRGYYLDDRVLRAARVIVAMPAEEKPVEDEQNVSGQDQDEDSSESV